MFNRAYYTGRVGFSEQVREEVWLFFGFLQVSCKISLQQGSGKLSNRPGTVTSLIPQLFLLKGRQINIARGIGEVRPCWLVCALQKRVAKAEMG